MPIVTVTAASAGADTLTAVAHGLATGDRFHLRNVGGAFPTASPSLAPATDYFASRVDADTVKIYDTNAHALAGGGTGLVDITSALGAGTTTIEYGLPYCIPTVIPAAGGQARSADFLGAFNALVAVYNLLVGLTQTIWSAVTFAVAVTFNAAATFAAGLTLGANQHVTLSGTGLVRHGTRTLSLPVIAVNIQNTTHGVGSVTMTNPSTFQSEIRLPLGARILAARIRIQDSATGPTKGVIKVCSSQDGGAVTVIGTSAASAGSGAFQTIAITGLTTVTASLTSYWVAVSYNTGTANMLLANCEIDYDQP